MRLLSSEYGFSVRFIIKLHINWSSSQYASNNNNAWNVNLGSGNVNNNNKNNNNNVLCVRAFAHRLAASVWSGFFINF